jgi:hypothetical protein
LHSGIFFLLSSCFRRLLLCGGGYVNGRMPRGRKNAAYSLLNKRRCHICKGKVQKPPVLSQTSGLVKVAVYSLCQCSRCSTNPLFAGLSAVNIAKQEHCRAGVRVVSVLPQSIERYFLYN